MTIRYRSGSARLVRGVRRYFEANAITAQVDFGDRALTQQLNQGPGSANRVVFCPFDPNSGDAGTLQEPLILGIQDIPSEDDPSVRVGTTRALVDWARLFVVSAWSFDADCPEDELAQQDAAEGLIEDVISAVQAVVGASAVWGRIRAVTQGERRFGRELRAVMTFTHPLLERPAELASAELELTKTMKATERDRRMTSETNITKVDGQTGVTRSRRRPASSPSRARC
jgi:hypothetical protein